MTDTWVSYWNREEAMAGPLWKAQADFFIQQLRRELRLDAADIVLDIGCGNGYVAAGLSPFVRGVHGADTSARSVAEAASRHAACGNIHFHALPPDDYLALDALPVPPPTFIMAVSVVQYYKSLDELRGLIAAAKSIGAPGSRMLIADLLVDYNIYKDILGVLLGGLQSGTFLTKLREAFSGSHSVYTRIREKNPVLTMTRKDVTDICSSLGVDLRFIPRNLTGNCFRAHALIELNESKYQAN